MSGYVVRVVLPDGVHELTPDLRMLLLLQSQAGIVALHRDDQDGMCFDLLPPVNVVSQKWADKVAADFMSYGYNAVRAPAT